MNKNKLPKEKKEAGLTVVLNVYDRLNIQNLAPKQVDFITADIYSDVKNKVAITQEEVKSLGFKLKYGNSIDLEELNNKVKPKKITFTELEIDVLKLSARELNKAKGFNHSIHNTCKILGMKREDFEVKTE